MNSQRIACDTLIKTYKRFLKEPNKIFVATDFTVKTTRYRESYLHVLIVLKLIEEVPTIYLCGKYRRTRRQVHGYRLLKKNDKEILQEE